MPRYPDFIVLSRFFRILDTKEWKGRMYQGMTIASAEAIYFAIDEGPRRSFLEFGFIGKALFGYSPLVQPLPAQLLPRSFDGVEVKAVSELPLDEFRHRNWPLPWADGKIIIVYKSAVRAMRAKYFSNLIELDGLTFDVLPQTALEWDLLSGLRCLGWSVT